MQSVEEGIVRPGGGLNISGCFWKDQASHRHLHIWDPGDRDEGPLSGPVQCPVTVEIGTGGPGRGNWN